MVIPLLLTACNGCQPKLPYNADDGQVDTSPPPDTAAETGDTGPTIPALCDVEEVEPNGTLAEAMALPMDVWACGTFSTMIDPEYFTVATSEDAWITVDVEAAGRGSPADVQLQIFEGSSSALKYDGYLDPDPILTFPAVAGEQWQIVLSESDAGSGEDYRWWVQATVSKPPVEWTFEEVEDNDGFDVANTFTIGETVFGVIETAGDFDYYKITVPEAGSYEFNVVASELGSTANLKLILWDAEFAQLREDKAGEIVYDLDPWFIQRASAATEWYLTVRDEQDRGSPFHWYTLSITPVVTE